MISKKGERFLESMRGYLISRGRNETEIEEFLKEAKTHIIEGEKDGKSVEDIFGTSPKKYAEELVSVMSVSVKENIKLTINFLIGIFSFTIVSSLIDSSLNLSIFEIIGFPLILFLWITFTIIAFRMTSFKSEYRQFFLDWAYMMIPSASTMGFLYFRNTYDQTILTLDGTPRYTIAVILAVVMTANLASLFNFKFSLVYVSLVLGSLLLFEFFKLDQFMYNEIRFLIVGILTYPLWHLYGKKILIKQIETSGS